MMVGKTTCSDSFHWKKRIDLQHFTRLQHQQCCTILPSAVAHQPPSLGVVLRLGWGGGGVRGIFFHLRWLNFGMVRSLPSTSLPESPGWVNTFTATPHHSRSSPRFSPWPDSLYCFHQWSSCCSPNFNIIVCRWCTIILNLFNCKIWCWPTPFPRWNPVCFLVGLKLARTFQPPKNSRHAYWYHRRRHHRNWIHPGKPASRIRSKPQTSRPRHLVWPHMGWTPQRYNVTRLPEDRSSKTDVKIPATKYNGQALPTLRTTLLWVREPCLARCHSSLCCPKSRALTGKHGKDHPTLRVDHPEERTPRLTAMALVTMATCNRLSNAVSPPEKLTNSSCVLVSPRSIC